MTEPPSGEQFELASAGYRCVITQSGAALRVLERDGRPLLDGFAPDQMSSGGRGQLLMPWPNRIRDGRYSFGGRDLQLALTEPARANASHGLARWAAWRAVEQTSSRILMTLPVMAQTGYPWRLDLSVEYALGPGGLHVTQSATNRGDEPAPYASGAHPYLTLGDGPVDSWELTVPAARRAVMDDRLVPIGTEPVTGTAHDFRRSRPIGGLVLDDAFTDLDRDARGVATVILRDPETGRSVALWVDAAHRWLQLYSADDVPATRRRSLAVEPMTAPGEAFRSGADLVVLEPGQTFAASWGIGESQSA